MQAGLLIFGTLLGGFVLGGLARQLIPGGRRLTLAEATLVGIAGSGVGAVAMNVSTPDTSPTAFQGWTILGVFAGAVVVFLAIIGVMRWRGWRSDPEPATAAQLVAAGESHTVEFKQTARFNVHTEQRDPRIELVIAKTVAGFLNADGGTLIIGVDDDGHPVGLDADLGLMKEPDMDRYELWVADHLERCLGKPALASIRVTFEPIDELHVCRIDVEPSPDAVFLDEPGGGREADMYVRMGNSTRKLLTDEALEYVSHHWKRRARTRRSA